MNKQYIFIFYMILCTICSILFVVSFAIANHSIYMVIEALPYYYANISFYESIDTISELAQYNNLLAAKIVDSVCFFLMALVYWGIGAFFLVATLATADVALNIRKERGLYGI